MVSSRSRSLVTPEQAGATHEAAHELNDAALHRLALDLMPLCGLEHIATDPLDEKASGDEWTGNDLPLVVTLTEDVLCQVGPSLNGIGETVDFVTSAELTDTPFASDPRYQVHSGDVGGPHAPVYDLCLVRKAERHIAIADGLMAGEPLDIGPLRETGTFRFPVVAQRFDGEPVQVHKVGDRVVAFGMDGEVVEAHVEALQRQDIPQAIWFASLLDGDLTLCDVLVHGYHQAASMPFSGRKRWLDDGPVAEIHYVADPKGLLALEEGRWLLRWQEDMSDLTEPAWFLYDAQTVRPGQYVELVPFGTERPSGDVVEHTLQDGLRCQAHISGDRSWIFAADCAIDRSAQLLQVRDDLLALRCQSAVLDGHLVSGVTPKKLRSLLYGRKDLSKEEIEFVSFDCLYQDGTPLHKRPLVERLATLRTIGGGACPGDGTVLHRPADSHYALDGSSSGWCVVDETNPPPKPNPWEHGLSEREMSAQWVDDIWQDADPVRFSYQRRYDGLLMNDEATAALNFIMGGKGVDGISVLSVPIGELREQYRAADWRDVGDVVSLALEDSSASSEPGSVVALAAASGELRIEAPPTNEKLLVLSQGVVRHALQFLAAPDHIEELGIDTLMDDAGEKWSASQLPLQDSEWLTAIGPGTLHWRDGSTFHVVAEGSAILGVQKPRFHEVFLMFDGDGGRSGRYIWVQADLDGEETWLGSKPDEQLPYAFNSKNQQSDSIEKARSDKGWVAWNPEGIRALADSSLKGLLPMNWESRMEPYDDAPFVDFR